MGLAVWFKFSRVNVSFKSSSGKLFAAGPGDYFSRYLYVFNYL